MDRWFSLDMKSTVTSRFFSFAQHLFFEEISPKFDEKALKHLMNTFYIFFEKIFFRFELVSTFYLRLYNEITDNEIELANIQSTDKVLVIGSGSLPATAELIVRKTNAHVSGIDRDYQAAMRGKEYAKQHHLESKLHIIHSDGAKFDVSSYDVIFVLYGIQGESELFSTIAGQMKNHARIIYRQPYDPGFSITSLPEFISEYFIVKNHKISPSLGSIISLVFEKKEKNR